MSKGKNPQKLAVDRKIAKDKKRMYKRRRMVASVLIIILIGIGIGMIVPNIKGTGESKGKKINNYMIEGNNDTANGDYNAAITNYQNALNLDSSNENATDLIKILQGYMKANSFYEAGDSGDASVELSNIPSSYTRYPIGKKIDELKEAIKKGNPNTDKQSDAKTTTDILNLSNLYGAGKYKEALALITSMEGDNLSPTQQAYVSEVAIGIDQKLNIKDAKNNKFYQKGKYLLELSNLDIAVNNMELGASTYEQKLTRAKDKYNKWNDELNKILNGLQVKMSSEDWTKLQNDENTWKTGMEAKAKESENDYTDSLVKQTANYQTQRELTKERCYYLVNTYV
ncbi:MAG: lysozyme inhibitor LprI family protein [Clostridium sp.]|uniref:lysozyme inhibitor LprI family protein n=1 Tax=Clostridium sp. TaxID=1506 RepID=UPI003F3144C8